MKTLPHTITALTWLSLSVGHVTIGQNASPTLPLPLAPPGPTEVFPNPSADAVASLQFAQANTDAQETLTLVSDAVQPAEVTAWSRYDPLRAEFLGGQPRPRTLVIRSSEIDPKSLSSLEEDLNVMSRIFSKALHEKNTDEDLLTAMGVRIKALTQPGQSSVQNLYLDGYGALFLFHVRFPLLPPPEPAKEDLSSKAPQDSVWEEAKRELYGPKGPAAVTRGLFGKEPNREAYDAKKVSKLKDSLIEALKNATNIRHLKPDECITVVVIGAETPPVMHIFRKVESSSDPSHGAVPRESGRTLRSTGEVRYATAVGGMPQFSGGESVMTIRVKKTTVDAFAKGDLTLEEFQKKVSTLTY